MILFYFIELVWLGHSYVARYPFPTVLSYFRGILLTPTKSYIMYILFQSTLRV